MDVLADMLALSGVRGTLGARIEAGSDWGWWSEPSAGMAAFHAVTAGTAWLALSDRPPVQLMPGDLLLLPRGDAHALGSDPSAVARTSPERFDAYEVARTGVVRIGSAPVRTHVLCAHYAHDPAVSTQVLAALPDVVHLRADDSSHMEDTVRLLARELAHPQLASAMVLDHLVDILLVQLLRTWLAGEAADRLPQGFGALRDPVVGAAVHKMHGDPSRAWTTEALARETAVSRATLARRFPAAIGESPAAYLTRWRMDLAAKRLRDTDDSLDAIAGAVGYTSVYAFSRAFRRLRSVPPGRYRTAARAERLALAS